MNRFAWLLCPVVLAASFNAHALEFNCKVAGDNRFLRVDLPGQEHLCEVSVTYQSGDRRVMWYADNDSLFCSAKAYELRDKYQDQWNFNCSNWPDRDGIDQLTPRQRAIVDTQLKSMIAKGQNATTPFTVTAIKAAASTLLNTEPGTLAIQYFLSTGDQIELIADDGDNWTVLANVDNLASFIDADVQVNTALLNSINSDAALTVSTEVQPADSLQGSQCHGTQVLTVSASDKLTARTPHRYVCESVAVN